MSKSHAAAGLRCGAAIAHKDVSALLKKGLAPYPLATPVVEAALSILTPENMKLVKKRSDIVTRRDEYAAVMAGLDGVISVRPSDTNYLLLEVHDAEALCNHANEAGIILRNQLISQALKTWFGFPLAAMMRCNNYWR